jgi:hypothetical protein
VIQLLYWKEGSQAADDEEEEEEEEEELLLPFKGEENMLNGAVVALLLEPRPLIVELYEICIV